VLLWIFITLFCAVSTVAGFSLFSGASNEWLSIFQAFARGAILMMFANSMIIMWLNLSLCAWILCFGLHSGFGKCGIKSSPINYFENICIGIVHNFTNSFFKKKT